MSNKGLAHALLIVGVVLLTALTILLFTLGDVNMAKNESGDVPVTTVKIK